jgi:hypothetical protein
MAPPRSGASPPPAAATTAAASAADAAHVQPDGTDRRLGASRATTALRIDDAPANIADAEGWHQPEPGWRWTTGDATLPPGRTIRVRTLPLLRYGNSVEPEAAVRRATETPKNARTSPASNSGCSIAAKCRAASPSSAADRTPAL